MPGSAPWSASSWSPRSSSWCRAARWRPPSIRIAGSPTPAGIGNTQALGQILYTDYFYLFQAAGVVLLIAMIGAIVLTHREREGVKRQRIGNQLLRDRRSVEIRKVTTGTGI